MSENKLPKPFLKWVGGKNQIIDKIVPKIPKDMNSYHELFLGGGSVLLAVLSLQKQKKIEIKNRIYAYDINDGLINLYNHVQKNKDELYKCVEKYRKEFDGLTGTEINRKPKNAEEAKTSKESYYYWVRSLYNNSDKTTVECAALFIFLNKTGFRGLYREGPNGYNVPYGHCKKTPTIVGKEDLDCISELIKDVVFKKADFSLSFENVTLGDFVYLDPPYAPENSKSFVGYVADGFTVKTHDKLFNCIKDLIKKDIKFVMSNAKVELVTSNFQDCKCEDVIARRAINSKNPGSKTIEIIIYN